MANSTWPLPWAQMMGRGPEDGWVQYVFGAPERSWPPDLELRLSQSPVTRHRKPAVRGSPRLTTPRGAHSGLDPVEASEPQLVVLCKLQPLDPGSNYPGAPRTRPDLLNPASGRQPSTPAGSQLSWGFLKKQH